MSSVWEDLLPGIPHDVTLTHLATKLPWTALNTLSAVSRTWHRAIESREVYGERIRCGSTETLVVVKHLDGNNPSLIRNAISLYSMRERTVYQLPPIPNLPRKSQFSKLVSVEGRLYVFGLDCRCKCYHCSDKWPAEGSTFNGGQDGIQIYMLDLAGQRQWTKCTSIEEPELEYELRIACGFKVRDKHYMQGGSLHWFDSSWQVCPSVENEWSVEEREWRPTVEPSHGLGFLRLAFLKSRFMFQGNYYKMRRTRQGSGRNHEIFVYDIDTKSWCHRQSISSNEIALEMIAALGRCTFLIINPLFILPVNNELLALAFWIRDFELLEPGKSYGRLLLQSSGFGTESKDIVWQKISGPLHFDSDTSFAVCPIQL